MSSYVKRVAELTGNDSAKPMSKGNDADITGYIDTGSFLFNAQVSGSIFKGLPENRIVVFGGEQSAGKTYFALNAAEQFVKKHPKGEIMYFDTEYAVTTDMVTTRNIPLDRIALIRPKSVQDFRTQCIGVLDGYLEDPVKDRVPLLFVLDSLGALSTTKELEDTSEGSETTDMTKAKLFKSTFRVLTPKFGEAKLPLIVTNHVYDEQGVKYPSKILSGGSGAKYASTLIFFFSKSKKKDSDGEITGNLINVTTNKSRLTVENKRMPTLLDFKFGLNRYYGLLDIASKYGIIEKVSTKFKFPNGESAFESVIYKDPEKWFTKEILLKIDAACGEEFKYGSTQTPPDDEEKEEDNGLD